MKIFQYIIIYATSFSEVACEECVMSGLVSLCIGSTAQFLELFGAKVQM